MGGRALPQPLRPVFAVVGMNMRQARLNIRLGFASLTATPAAGTGNGQTQTQGGTQ